MQVLSKLPKLDTLRDAWQIGRKVLQRRSAVSSYEVPEYKSTLELHDRGGERATFTKREKVRYFQDNVIAYQDQAWGDGEILLDYCCAPGVSVDRCRSGLKTYILISQREVKSRGDEDEFRIE
jgi:hypothetical protein